MEINIYIACFFSTICFAWASPVLLKSVDGKSIQATINGVENDEVVITKEDGKTFRIPLARLDESSKSIVATEIAKISPKADTKPIQHEDYKSEIATKEYSKADIDNAYYTSRNFIKKALTAPSTAKFSNPILDKTTTGSVVTNEGRIQSKGIVEAQNSFGVPLSKSWSVVVQPEGNDGKQWRIVYAVLGEDILMDTRKDHKTEKSVKADTFIGMTYESMIAKLGQPSKTTKGSNDEDGDYNIYTYSNEKGKETLFTIWDSDGVISSGCFNGVYFSK
jgi:hypothetical protein